MSSLWPLLNRVNFFRNSVDSNNMTQPEKNGFTQIKEAEFEFNKLPLKIVTDSLCPYLSTLDCSNMANSSNTNRKLFDNDRVWKILSKRDFDIRIEPPIDNSWKNFYKSNKIFYSVIFEIIKDKFPTEYNDLLENSDKKAEKDFLFQKNIVNEFINNLKQCEDLISHVIDSQNLDEAEKLIDIIFLANMKKERLSDFYSFLNTCKSDLIKNLILETMLNYFLNINPIHIPELKVADIFLNSCLKTNAQQQKIFSNLNNDNYLSRNLILNTAQKYYQNKKPIQIYNEENCENFFDYCQTPLASREIFRELFLDIIPKESFLKMLFNKWIGLEKKSITPIYSHSHNSNNVCFLEEAEKIADKFRIDEFRDLKYRELLEIYLDKNDDLVSAEMEKINRIIAKIKNDQLRSDCYLAYVVQCVNLGLDTAENFRNIFDYRIINNQVSDFNDLKLIDIKISTALLLATISHKINEPSSFKYFIDMIINIKLRVFNNTTSEELKNDGSWFVTILINNIIQSQVFKLLTIHEKKNIIDAIFDILKSNFEIENIDIHKEISIKNLK